MSKETRYYKNNPITEALCMVVLEPGDSLDISLPGRMVVALDHYKGKNEQRTRFGANVIDAEFNFGLPQTFNQYFLTSEDNKDVLSLAHDRIGVHRVKEYKSWSEDLKPRTRNALTAYLKETSKASLNAKFAIMRYINKISLPTKEGNELDTSDYINIEPPASECLPKLVSTFDQRTTYLYGDGAVLELKFKLLPRERQEDGSVHFILDFELKKEIKDSLLEVEDVMSVFQDLREKQYAAFESLITDTYRSLIK